MVGEKMNWEEIGKKFWLAKNKMAMGMYRAYQENGGNDLFMPYSSESVEKLENQIFSIILEEEKTRIKKEEQKEKEYAII